MIDWSFPYSSQRMPILADNIVSTSQPLAAQAGLKMLMLGGNAVDAVLAAAIALTVVEPTSNGIGSDAFALIWDGKKLSGINGSGCSPAAWSREYFARYKEMPLYGWDTITVPGAVSTWLALSRRFGSLPFKQICQPAIAYARQGFLVSPITAQKWEETADNFREFDEFAKIFLPDGNAPRSGSRFTCEHMACTLEEIASTQGESFYRGNLARQIARCSQEQGGALSYEDLASHQPFWVEPLVQEYRGYELNEIPPNGQGIAALIALGILKHYDLHQYPLDSADSVHLQVEAMKLAFADVFRHLADHDAMRVDCKTLLDPEYLKMRADSIDMSTAHFPESGIADDHGTVYLAAADAAGMMVSFIQSNFHGFGSGVVIPDTGISMHNRGHGFTLEENHPNQVGGGKRPFQTIIPGFVMKNGHPLMSFGVMGAHMQAQGHVQMMTRLFAYGQNPQAASDAPRWHVMQDNQLALERGFPTEVIDELHRRGHSLLYDEPPQLFGGAQLIYKTAGGYIGASDHRKDGQAVGF
ncbi:MAG: gamma-glutamyltransferase family protein [Deltaproteobacteria bacterium]|nr:gamma-glutamyltransferase family protein [Deltaproteobacteria bacterium]